MTAVAGHVSQLHALEAEAVFVIREVAAELKRPVLLFSGGKDSIVLLRLAEKAFRPLPLPLPLPVLHVDTGHNFPEAHQRRVIKRDGVLLAQSQWVGPQNGEQAEEAIIRYRTVGARVPRGARCPGRS
jgi:fermentation-respiration switch protein FrsA (DUF1100 family)